MGGFLDVDGVTLETAWVGPKQANGADLVLLHEGLGCVALWRGVPERLAEMTGRRVLVYSRQGYGGSDPCALPRPLDFMNTEATDVLPRVLDAAGIERCVTVGHSDGGTIALLHGASQDPRVEAVVTIAAHVFNEPLCIASIEDARRAFAETDLRDKLARYHGANVDCAFKGWNDVWLDPGFEHWTIEAALPAVTQPVLAVQGSEDEYGSESQVDAIVAGVAGRAEKKMIADARHSPHLQDPDETLAAIVGFIDSL